MCLRPILFVNFLEFCPILFMSFLEFMFPEFVKFKYLVASEFTKIQSLSRDFKKLDILNFLNFLSFLWPKRKLQIITFCKNLWKEYRICQTQETINHIMTENFTTKNFCKKICQKNMVEYEKNLCIFAYGNPMVFFFFFFFFLMSWPQEKFFDFTPWVDGPHPSTWTMERGAHHVGVGEANPVVEKLESCFTW